jgi:hypothetical protein
MEVDAEGHILLAGNVTGIADFGGGPIGQASVRETTGFLVRLDRSGAHVSTRAFPAAEVERCALGQDGAVVIFGRFRGTASFGGTELSSDSSHRFLVKLDASGAPVYAKRLDEYWRFRIALDPSGNLYMFGNAGDGGDFSEETFPPESKGRLFLAKLDPKGAFLWGRWFAGTGVAFSSDMAITPDGGVLLAGTFTQDLKIGPEPLASIDPGRKATPFLARFAPDGAALWSRCFGDGELCAFSQVRILDAGHAVVCGTAAGDIDLGAGRIPGTGRFDTFVAKLVL